MRLHVRVRLAALLTVAVAGTTLVPATGNAAVAGPSGGGKHGLKVMTQNLYLGSSLTPALLATTQLEFVGAVANIYGTAVATDFPTRAKAIADTIDKRDPDLIGLQEVTRWKADALNPTATPPSYNFLAILRKELAARGLNYKVKAVSENADIGPAPLVAPAFGCEGPVDAYWVPDCLVTLQDRDVILVNKDTPRLKVLKARSGDYTAQQEFTPPGSEPVSFARGWTYINAKFHGRKFRFVNTHLETEDFAAVQEAQGREFLAGPAKTKGVVIATGDFNSAADSSTTRTYAYLTRRFDDVWDVKPTRPGFTCCQNSSLSNVTSELRTRIDLILTRGRVSTKQARVVGHRKITTSGTPPLWASDHAGVVAKLRMP